MATGKRLTALEMPEDDMAVPAAAVPAEEFSRPAQHSIPLPPIPVAPKRQIMVQLSVKAPNELVERLERMTRVTGAQKQAVLAAALDAYLGGHGY